ncbi:hypothetical protein YQE_11305, partial [Dendroctonus ponderosae]
MTFLPGTCVDTEIAHPYMQDFYLVSHASIQGVAKPTKYVTLWDDNDMTNDQIEQLAYYLCHMFTRCTRSVSYPAPTYYAHLAAARGRVYIENDQLNMSRLRDEFQKVQILDTIRKDFPIDTGYGSGFLRRKRLIIALIQKQSFPALSGLLVEDHVEQKHEEALEDGTDCENVDANYFQPVPGDEIGNEAKKPGNTQHREQQNSQLNVLDGGAPRVKFIQFAARQFEHYFAKNAAIDEKSRDYRRNHSEAPTEDDGLEKQMVRHGAEHPNEPQILAEGVDEHPGELADDHILKNAAGHRTGEQLRSVHVHEDDFQQSSHGKMEQNLCPRFVPPRPEQAGSEEDPQYPE